LYNKFSSGKLLLSQWANVKVRQWSKVLQWLDLLLLKQWLKEELTEPGNQATIYALRHMTSLSKFPVRLEFSLVNKSNIA